MFSRNPNYELTLTGILPAFSPSGDQFVTNSPPTASPRGASSQRDHAGDRRFQGHLRGQEPQRAGGGWSPDGERIIFGIGVFDAFFNGFHSRFLKAGDRIEGGAQIAIINADGSGFQELTAARATTPSRRLRPTASASSTGPSAEDGDGLRIMNLETKAVTTLTRDTTTSRCGRRAAI